MPESAPARSLRSTEIAANAARESIAAMDTADVHLAGVRPAHEVTDLVGKRRFLHAGPPVELDNVVGPMRGAIIGGLIFEDDAADPAAAEAIIDSGGVELSPCHAAGALGAMAGIVTPNMPVVVARSDRFQTFSALNEGTGGAIRYGSFDDATIAKMRWMAEVMAPALNSAVEATEPIDLVDLVGEGLRRGDECHNRLAATTTNLLARLAAPMIEAAGPDAATATLRALVDNPHAALPFAIATAKAMALHAADVAGSPIVTAMAANGREFGIQVAGLGDRWFTAPSPVGTPVLADGVSIDDVNPTMGDSLIAETVGFGAFAMPSAPAIMSFVGGTFEESLGIVEEMRSICEGESSRFLIPALNHRGTPVGINVHRVRESGVAPVVNNGLAHREAGRGRAGAGITRVPTEPFVAASEALASAAADSRG